MSRALKRTLRRWLYIGHRWIGIITCLFFAMWFISGVVMMYVAFPGLSDKERLAALPDIRWEKVTLSPDDAMKKAGATRYPRGLRLSMLADEPVYRMTAWDGTRLVISAADGRAITNLSEGQALAIAQYHPASRTPQLEEIVDRDQWSVTARYDPLRPLYLIALGDDAGTKLYVSSRSGEIALPSLFIVGFIADHFGAKRAYVTTGVAACLSPWAFVLFADGFWSAFWLHALTGLCQGGTYTPALALINDHVERARRGRAMGYLIAGSSAGYAICLGVAGVALQFTGWRGALAAVAVLPLISWITALIVLRDTPNTVHPRPAGESLLASLPAVWRNRRGMLSIWGYAFHNWELLGLWAWLPAFLTAVLVFHGSESPATFALVFAALTYVANIAGSIAGGTMADRWGRTQTILLWSCVSLALSFSLGWLLAEPVFLVVALACLYNFAGIADSSTHSTVLAESVPPHYLGVAYAVRSVIGFGAGVVSPVVFGWALDLAGGARSSHDALAWGIAWSTLGLGALWGPLATWRLQRASWKSSTT